MYNFREKKEFLSTSYNVKKRKRIAPTHTARRGVLRACFGQAKTLSRLKTLIYNGIDQDTFRKIEIDFSEEIFRAILIAQNAVHKHIYLIYTRLHTYRMTKNKNGNFIPKFGTSTNHLYICSTEKQEENENNNPENDIRLHTATPRSWSSITRMGRNCQKKFVELLFRCPRYL